MAWYLVKYRSKFSLLYLNKGGREKMKDRERNKRKEINEGDEKEKKPNKLRLK
jgi:hypothetical protein